MLLFEGLTLQPLSFLKKENIYFEAKWKKTEWSYVQAKKKSKNIPKKHWKTTEQANYIILYGDAGV